MCLWAIGCVTFAMALVSGSAATRVRADAGHVVRLAVAGRSNAHPSIAAVGSFVAVAWAASAPAGGGDVFVAVSRDGGATFTAPVQANSDAGEGRAGGEMPPRVVLAPVTSAGNDPDLVVVWRAKGTSTSIRAARSRDGGRRFEPAVSVQDAGAAGERGWQTAAVGPDGRVHAIWLDHRGLAPAGGGTGHAAHRKMGGEAGYDGVAMAQRSGVYYAALEDRAHGTLHPDTRERVGERELAKGVCYCCKTALAAGPNGGVYAAWRHVYEGNIRDIAFIASRDGGRSFGQPTRVSEDGWQLAGCPDDGPAMVVDGEGVVHLVWPTVIGGEQPEGALFYASSRDGRTFTPRVRVPTLGSPRPSHPQIAQAPDGTLVIGWDESRDGLRTVAAATLRHVDGRATFGPPFILADGQSAAVYPVFASTSRGVVAVWSSGSGEGSAIAVRRLDLTPRPASP